MVSRTMIRAVLLVLGYFTSDVYGQSCGRVNKDDYGPCFPHEKEPANRCRFFKVGGASCCHIEGLGCRVSFGQVTPPSINQFQTYARGKGVVDPPDAGRIPDFLSRIPDSNNAGLRRALGAVTPNFKRRASQRNLQTALILGAFSGSSAFSFLPKCAVHVKLCYRVPCGGYSGNRNLDDDPSRCLSDPTCCYDYQLSFLKSIFGPNVMGGAPTCYYGPTSRQWRYITGFFQPWNPFYGPFILSTFSELFNTNAFNIGGQFVCQIDFQRKNYPVGSKSKLECNLVSGCWVESNPAGKQCTMASSLIERVFSGVLPTESIYPSLFTNDRSDTRCASNWFDFGPRAYRRMECDIADEPSDFFQKIYNWCPINDCCINYAGLSSADLGQLALFNALGRPIGGGILPISGGLPSLGGGGAGGLPFIFGNQFNQAGQGSTPLNSNILYLLAASNSGSSDLSDLFCPYKNFFSIFVDLSEMTEGCCDIPKCYHKKRFIGGTAPGPNNPSILPFPTYPGTWGQWSQCNVPCGQQGTRYRTCYVNGQVSQSSSCEGSDSETCSGSCQPPPPPPPPPSSIYSWGSWQAISSCTVTCGGGTRRYRRSCLYNQQTVSASSCPGGFGSSEKSEGCNFNPCPAPPPPPPQPSFYSWGSWQLYSACSVNCGGGTRRYRRPCLYNNQQTVSASFCPGGLPASEKTESCNNDPCTPPPPPPPPPPQPDFYSWGSWSAYTACPVTCGGGTMRYRRSCLYNNQQVVSASSCPGGFGASEKSESCNVNPCPGFGYRWSDRYMAGSCSVTCGVGTITYQKYCMDSQGNSVGSYLCPQPPPTPFQNSCDRGSCPIVGPAPYEWYPSERITCPSDNFGRYCIRITSQVCYQRLPSGLTRVPNQSICGSPPQPSTQTSCSLSECP